MLVLSWHFRASTMCEYSRDEFVHGMLRLRCDSIAKLQQRLPELRRDLQDPQKFKVSPPDAQHPCIVPLCTAWERAQQERSLLLRREQAAAAAA